jgi:hypothetical protein
VIIDEVQRFPELLSLIQAAVDEQKVMGSYIISESENLLLSEKISQSLAERAAYVSLPTFANAELEAAGLPEPELYDRMFRGFYPAVYDRNLEPGMCYMVQSVCADWHIELIEDAAESPGSFFAGKHTGTFGRIGILSFNGNKTVTTGGGGMLLFQNQELGDRAKHLTTQAKIPHIWEFKHDAVGYNYRMPNINAALGCAQTENIEVMIDNKRSTALAYKQFFFNTGIAFFDEPKNCRSNFWLNAIVLQSKEKQLKFLTETNNNGIKTRPIWELMNRLPMFADCQCGNLEYAEWFAERVVNIPSGFRVGNNKKCSTLI